LLLFWPFRFDLITEAYPAKVKKGEPKLKIEPYCLKSGGNRGIIVITNIKSKLETLELPPPTISQPLGRHHLHLTTLVRPISYVLKIFWALKGSRPAYMFSQDHSKLLLHSLIQSPHLATTHFSFFLV